MIQQNIKTKGRDSGFTIVELLVVIVVIGILAAITIVSYTGVTTRAKAAQSQSNAASLQSVVEAYNAELGYYPRTILNITTPPTTNVTKMPAGVTIQGTDPTTGNGQTTLRWDYCGAAAAPAAGAELGGRITWWDYNGTPGVKYIAVGSGLAQAGNPGTANCNTWVAAS